MVLTSHNLDASEDSQGAGRGQSCVKRHPSAVLGGSHRARSDATGTRALIEILLTHRTLVRAALEAVVRTRLSAADSAAH